MRGRNLLGPQRVKSRRAEKAPSRYLAGIGPTHQKHPSDSRRRILSPLFSPFFFGAEINSARKKVGVCTPSACVVRARDGINGVGSSAVKRAVAGRVYSFSGGPAPTVSAPSSEAADGDTDPTQLPTSGCCVAIFKFLLPSILNCHLSGYFVHLPPSGSRGFCSPIRVY